MHGTDTLAYTASALSFMLENLGKTVIVTGINNNTIYCLCSLSSLMLGFISTDIGSQPTLAWLASRTAECIL